MNRKLGEINRGSSVTVGSIGTISSLMSKELESSSTSSRKNPQSAPVSVSCGERSFKLRKSVDQVQKTGTRSNSKTKQRSPENTRGTHQDRISVLGLATPKPRKPKVSIEEGRSPEKTRVSHQDRISALSLATPKQQKPKVSMEDSRSNVRSPELSWKTRSHKRTHHMPMLESEEKTKPAWRVNFVEVVDSNCRVPAGTLSSRLKKLGFAKLSQSII